MEKELKLKLQEFEAQHNCTVVYVTKYGSKLYGTDNPNSDTDYKGVFIPNMNDVLLKKDLDHWTSNSNNTNEKNGAEDIDLQLFSLHKFFQLLRKGETGALDLLFSMKSPSIVFEDTVFTDHMKMYTKHFLNRGLHSFTGYAVGQAKKYGIKGTRYKELVQFNEEFCQHTDALGTDKLSTMFPYFRAHFRNNKTKYLEMTMAEGPKTGKGENQIEYVKVLGKLFSGDVTFGYFMERAVEQEAQFGNRAKSSAEGVDWKALSHSVRVLFEVEELLQDHKITFPLKQREFVTEVKEGKVLVDAVMMFVNKKLDDVKAQLDRSNLPEFSDRETMDWLELFFLELHGKDVNEDDNV